MQFRTKDGRQVDVDFRDDHTVQVSDSSGASIGSFTFSEREWGEDEWYLLVTNMHLEGPKGTRSYIGQGIGKFIVREAPGQYGYSVVFAPLTSASRDDGAHLTDMGVGFAQRMVAKGLADWEG